MRSGNVSADQLKSIIERIEKLEEEKAALAADIKDVWAESKGNGFNNVAIKAIIKLRKLDAQTREEQETMLDVYMRSIGMLPELDD